MKRKAKKRKRDWSPGDPWPGLSHGEVVAVVMERGSSCHGNSWAGGSAAKGMCLHTEVHAGRRILLGVCLIE